MPKSKINLQIHILLLFVVIFTDTRGRDNSLLFSINKQGFYGSMLINTVSHIIYQLTLEIHTLAALFGHVVNTLAKVPLGREVVRFFTRGSDQRN